MSPDRLARFRTFLRRSALAALCLLALVLSALAGAALAQEQTTPAQVDPLATRIEVDEQANVIRFFIDGEERAVLDADGFHINGDIDYTGTITDGNRYSVPRADEWRAQ